MKTIFKAALLICAFFVVNQTIVGQQNASSASLNLLEDGGVTNNAMWRFSCGTNPDTGVKPENCISIDSSLGKSAPGSILLVGNGGREWRSMQYTKSILVEPGKKYHISGWVKTENISKKSRVYFDFNVKTKNENGKPGEYLAKELMPKTNEMAFDKVKGTHDWTLIECAYIIPETAYFIVNFRVRYDPVIDDSESSKVWFDDLLIQEIK
jgi:hypothetical protein